MPKPKNEDLIKLEQVPKIVYELTGIARTLATVYNWIKVGRTTQHGERVKLKSSKRLGNLYTTKEWLMEFIREVG